MASVYKVNATGGAAISASLTVPAGRHYQLVSVSVKMSAAPTTSENFTITLNCNAGSDYDVLLYSVDLAAGSTTDLFWAPDDRVLLEPGDAIDVAYTNTDSNTYGLQITAEA